MRCDHVELGDAGDPVLALVHGNAFYLIPGANHYLQNDRPDAFVTTVLRASVPGPEA